MSRSEAMILKRDAGGRVMVPVERQIELVREYERGGLSGPKFAAMALPHSDLVLTPHSGHIFSSPVKSNLDAAQLG